jgi:hypothetical protein
MNFEYFLTKEGTQEPRIPLLAEGKYGLFALLDSGADITIVPIRIAQRMNIKSHPGKPTFGITGILPSQISSLHIQVEGGREKYAFTIPVKIVDTQDDIPLLLGRNGFFSEFIISFNEPQKSIVLEKV